MTETYTRADYHDAVRRAENWSRDRLNSWDKQVWWTTVGRMLSEHAPAPDEDTCPKCKTSWPCEEVAGPIDDVKMGKLGY